MVSMSMFCRMILSEKSKTFWDHALAQTASRFPGQGGPREQGCDRLPAR